MLTYAPAAEAQFFWSPWLQEQPKRPKVRAPKPKPPGDDLPPIVPKESSAPPPPDDRPYDPKLLRLAEILGAVHYLRELCGAEEGQLWRNQMKDVLKNEGSTAVRRAKLVNSFNDGYRGYRRTYRTCTSSATLAITRFSTEGAQIAVALANPSSAYASRAGPVEAAPQEGAAGTPAPSPDQAAPAPGATPAQPSEANANPAAPAGSTAPAGAGTPATGAAPAPGATPATGAAPTAAAPEAATGQGTPAAGTPETTGTAPEKPKEAATGETQINPDATGEQPAAPPKKKKKRARKQPAPSTTGFFFRN